jgi:hypothetical protein
MPISIALAAADVEACLSEKRWWEIAALRRLLHGQSATILGHDAGPRPEDPAWAFLATDVSLAFPPGVTVRRFFVILPRQAVLTLDLAAAPGPLRWDLIPSPGSRLSHRRILPDAKDPTHADGIALNALALPGSSVEPVLSVDLAGGRVGSTVVLFHTETGMARTAVFFEMEASGRLNYLLAGLAPGGWDIWRDGYLEDTEHGVRPAAGTLFFEGEPGNYFIRHR